MHVGRRAHLRQHLQWRRVSDPARKPAGDCRIARLHVQAFKLRRCERNGRQLPRQLALGDIGDVLKVVLRV